MKRFVSIVVMVLVLIVSLASASQSLTVKPCKVGKEAPAFGFWTWAPKSTIKVYILKADFADSDVPYLLTPIAKWNAVSEISGSEVKFEYRGTTFTPLYCENCLTIMRGPVFDKAKRHATELRTYSARNDQIMTWAHITIDKLITNQQALTNAVAHELGHNFGLLDCYTCKQRSTVMNQFKVINQPNGMEGPTPCDIAQVRAAFSQLALRVRPSPQVAEVEDEGSEPEDDDTPVTLPDRP